MLKVKEYVVIVEDFDGMKLWEMCFSREEMANNYLQRIKLPKRQIAILIQRMA